MNLSKQRRAGFTLTELLVVLAIISLMSTIVLVNVNLARNKGKNARAVAEVSQYLTGLALARERDGAYPSSSSLSCLGGSSASCRWGGASSFGHNTTVTNALTPVMSSLPSSSYQVGNYQGYSYQSSGTNTYTINWFLYGTGRNCEFGTGTNSGDITLCTYTRNN
jgi:prepilin-type N-terminal cleavage/methylation domain-containing protein